MKLLKTLVIATTLIISCNHLFAQKKEDTAGVEKKWYIKGAFRVSETQSLAIWTHKKDEYGIVMVNNKGVIEWEIPFDGCIFGISKYKDHFLVFHAKKGYYNDNYGITKFIKQINAATIDIKSQQIIEDKEIYKGSKYVYADILNDPAGNFSQLLLYHWTGIFGTKGFTLITFNTDGSVANKEISGSDTEDKYTGSSATTSYVSRNAVVSVFDKKMKLQREIIINKGTMSYSYVDIGLSCHINNDKLYMLVGENAGLGKYDNICYNVNLNESNYERKKIGTNRPSWNASICTFSTIWFKNEFVMTQLRIGSFFDNISSYSSKLERVGFDEL